MSLSRRQLLRLLRIKNLLLLTLLLIVLYMVKLMGSLENNEYKTKVLDVLQMPQNYLYKKSYFVPYSLEKIDWHDYKLIKEEKKRVGPGEQGLPAHLPKSDAALEEELYSVNGFNGALSDKISLNRSIPDIRHPKCAEKLYIASLPTVSVVVPFHNEHWSSLLRTVHSVILRSPENLIKEIFLVDDASTKDFLKKKLDDYLAKHIPKARVIRLDKRSGLITARLAGAKVSTGDVLLFLDSHTEANVNWLPPLLEPIALDYRTVTCPYIDVIAYDTFEFRAQDEGARGAFDWELFYKRLPVLPNDQKNMPEPFASPVMAGGLFAMSRTFFWELGGYDPGLDIWGGEQYELSFKIWQCGGRMLDAPCSRVGHIYRKFAPFPNPGHGDFVGKNYRRVAEVWMDEYAEHLYSRRPHYRDIDPGDISEQKALRQKLHCKPFKWFMTQIAFDLTFKYPPVEPKPYAEGRVRPVSNLNMCLDSHHGEQMDKLLIRPCEASNTEQQFVLSWHKDIKCKSRNMCWDLPESAPKSSIRLFSCHLGGGNQLWRLTETKHIKHGDTDSCVEWDPVTRVVYINTCDAHSLTQQWTIDQENKELMDHWADQRAKPTGPVEEA